MCERILFLGGDILRYMHFANFADMQQISKARETLKEQGGAEEKVLNYINMIGGEMVAVSP